MFESAGVVGHTAHGTWTWDMDFVAALRVESISSESDPEM